MGAPAASGTSSATASSTTRSAWCRIASLPGKENFQAVFANFAKVFEEMAKSVPMLAGMMTNEFSAQAKVNGFPVRSRGYENGKLGDGSSS